MAAHPSSSAEGNAAVGREAGFLGVAVAGRTGVHDLSTHRGIVTSITPSACEHARAFLMPPLANAHAHANRAFGAPNQRPASLDAAARAQQQDPARDPRDEACAHAQRFFARSLVHATGSVRTHVDVDERRGLAALEGVQQAASVHQGALIVECVAFAHSRADLARASVRDLMRQAAHAGARWLGGVPAMHEDPSASLAHLLDLAVELGTAVDVHLDEHLKAGEALLPLLVSGTVARGLQGKVSVSHACSLSLMQDAERHAMLARMADAQITLISLPELNLYLQDRGSRPSPRRAVAPVGDALAHGVAVRFGTDNVRDAFYPFGDADMLDTAMVAALATHVDTAQGLLSCICGGRNSIEVGDPADFSLVEAECFDDALARRPAGRALYRGGFRVA